MFGALGDFVPDLPVDIPGLSKDSSKEKGGSSRRRDRYGFALGEEDEMPGMAAFDAFNPMAAMDKMQDAAQGVKWTAHMQREDPLKRNDELTELVRGGIADDVRGQVWLELSGAKAKQTSAPQSYYVDLLEVYKQQRTRERRKTLADIEKDIDRTFPENENYETEEGQWRLRAVLGPYAVRNRAVGYCQSMNFLAATLLLFQTDEEAFWTLAAICEDILPGFWYRDLLPVHVDQRVFKELIWRRLPDVGKHLQTLGVSVEVLSTQWFMCIYLNSLPIVTALRIWDNVMLEGGHVIFQVALALLHASTERIMAHESLDSFVEAIGSINIAGDDADELIALAFSNEVMGTAFASEVQLLRNKYRITMLEEQRKERRRANEYRVAQREVQKVKSARSPMASKVEASAAKAKALLADFALVQRDLADLATTATPKPKAEEQEPVVCCRTPEVALSEMHVAVIGLRGLGGEMARQVARAGVGHITLVDHRVAQGDDIDRNLLQPEHKDMLLVDAVAERLKRSITLANGNTQVSVESIDIGLASNAAALQRLLETGCRRDTSVVSDEACSEQDDGTSQSPRAGAVHTALLCVDSAAPMLAAGRLFLRLAIPYVECSITSDGSRGHTNMRIPGCTACMECAGKLPDFLDHTADAFGDGSTLMFRSSTMQILAATAVQRAISAVASGQWAARSAQLDALQAVALHEEQLLADDECENHDCQRLQLWQMVFQKWECPLSVEMPRHYLHPSDLAQDEDESILEKLNYKWSRKEIQELKECINLM